MVAPLTYSQVDCVVLRGWVKDQFSGSAIAVSSIWPMALHGMCMLCVCLHFPGIFLTTAIYFRRNVFEIIRRDGRYINAVHILYGRLTVQKIKYADIFTPALHGLTVSQLYCQNLSLFGKLFIDIKTLFFDCDNCVFPFPRCGRLRSKPHPEQFYSISSRMRILRETMFWGSFRK